MKTKSLVAFLSLAFCHIAGADELVFFDDFNDGTLGDNWMFPDEGLDIFQGRVRSTQNGRVITTLQEFSGDVRVELDFEKSGTQDHGCWDLAVRLTSLGGVNGVLRFDHLGIDAIAIGTGFNAICDGAETTSVAGQAANRGTAVLTYSDSMLDFTFMNDDGDILDAQAVLVGDTGPYQLLLCIAAHTNSPRFVDNVKVYSLASLGADFDGDGDVDGDDFIRWQIGFGDFPTGGAQKIDGDYDNDGDVDGDDFLGWQAEFGSGSGLASAAVPEPASIALLIALFVCATVVRRRQ